MNTYNFDTDTIHYKDQVIENFFNSFPQQKAIIDYVKDNLIMLCVGGSHAYGLATETSDVDIRGIFKDSIDQILGFGKIEQLANDSGDITIYSLTKALNLIADQNPNMLELLYVDEEDILYASEDYWYIRNQRDSLLSTHSMHKFSGYALSQLKRIKGHNKWLNKEQEGKFDEKPVIENYLTFVDNETGKVSSDFLLLSSHYFVKVKDELYNIFNSKTKQFPLIDEGNQYIPVQETSESDDEYYGILWFNKQQFKQDLDEYNKWKTWKENRNEKRHTLEEEFGYDTKHAMHTFRLLQMGIEILKGEGVKVKRSDRDYLLDMRNGRYTYEYVVETATHLDKNVLPGLYKNSKLPKSVDRKIVLEIIKKVIKI